METKKAEIEIKNLLDSGLSFEYDFDYNNVNKVNLAINREGYSIKDIISKLKQGEKITFMINDGETWNGKQGNESKFLYNEKLVTSLSKNQINYIKDRKMSIFKEFLRINVKMIFFILKNVLYFVHSLCLLLELNK